MDVLLPTKKRNKQEKKSGGARKYGRSKRRIRWPLMPDGLTPQQAWSWFNNRYAHTRADSVR